MPWLREVLWAGIPPSVPLGELLVCPLLVTGEANKILMRTSAD
jgi:hypothetical protein